MTNATRSYDWPWPDSLDAMAAAPEYHTLVFENDRVRVLDTRIRPGETTPIHTHRWPALYHVLAWGDFIRRDQDGKVLLDTRQESPRPAPRVVWAEAMPPHSLENVGASDLHVLSVELKQAT